MTIREIEVAKYIQDGVMLKAMGLMFTEFNKHPRKPGYYRSRTSSDNIIEISEETLKILKKEDGGVYFDNKFGNHAGTCDKYSFDFIGYEYTLEKIKSYHTNKDPRITEHTICAITFISPGDPRDESEYRNKMVEKAAKQSAITLEGYNKQLENKLTSVQAVIDEIKPGRASWESPWHKCSIEDLRLGSRCNYGDPAIGSYETSMVKYQGLGVALHMTRETVDNLLKSQGEDKLDILYRDIIPKWVYGVHGIYLLTTKDRADLLPWFLCYYRILESAKTLEMHFEQEYLDIEDRKEYDDNMEREERTRKREEEEARLEAIDRKENPWRYEEKEYVPDDPWDSIGPDEGWSRDGRPD